MSKTEKTPKLWSYRVNRGGSWYFIPQIARVVCRYIDYTDYRYDLLGFRLVEVLDE